MVSLRAFIASRCDYYGFTEGVYSFAGIGTMVLMTVEKFLCIWNPLNKLKFGETIILREFIIKKQRKFLLEGMLIKLNSGKFLGTPKTHIKRSEKK